MEIPHKNPINSIITETKLKTNVSTYLLIKQSESSINKVLVLISKFILVIIKTSVFRVVFK